MNNDWEFIEKSHRWRKQISVNPLNTPKTAIKMNRYNVFQLRIGETKEIISC